jgi:hypothetical protein
MSGAAEALVGRLVEGRIAVNETRPLAGLALSTILRASPERLSWLIVNRGTVEVSIAFSQDFTAGTGITIGPNGGSLSVNVDQDFLLPTFPVYALAGAAAQQLVVLEIAREA